MFEPIKIIRRSLTAAVLCISLLLLGSDEYAHGAERACGTVDTMPEAATLASVAPIALSASREPAGRAAEDDPANDLILIRPRRGPRTSMIVLAVLASTFITTCEQAGGLVRRLDPEEPPLWRHGNDTVRLRC